MISLSWRSSLARAPIRRENQFAARIVFVSQQKSAWTLSDDCGPEEQRDTELKTNRLVKNFIGGTHPHECDGMNALVPLCRGDVTRPIRRSAKSNLRARPGVRQIADVDKLVTLPTHAGC